MDWENWAAMVRLGVESEQDENLRRLRRVSHRVCEPQWGEEGVDLVWGIRARAE